MASRSVEKQAACQNEFGPAPITAILIYIDQYVMYHCWKRDGARGLTINRRVHTTKMVANSNQALVIRHDS